MQPSPMAETVRPWEPRARVVSVISNLLNEDVSKQFFFEKKNQKTFAPLRARVAPAATQQTNQSFFCFFFVHKKEDSSFPYPF
jgi:hypothetical protein